MRALLCLAFILATASVADAGPIRDRIRESRPGILVPKRTPAATCQPCQSSQQVVARPQATASVIPASFTWSQSGNYSCAGGNCPAPTRLIFTK